MIPCVKTQCCTDDRAINSTCTLKHGWDGSADLACLLEQGMAASPAWPTWPHSVSAQVCMPPAATCTTLCPERHGVGSGTSRLPWATPHCPYSFPPQAYACPEADTARLCQPPQAAWTILTPFKAAMRRGFFSFPLQAAEDVMVQSEAHQECDTVSSPTCRGLRTQYEKSKWLLGGGTCDHDLKSFEHSNPMIAPAKPLTPVLQSIPCMC